MRIVDAQTHLCGSGLPGNMAHRPRTALAIVATVLSLMAGGCASLANTPAQDAAWTRWGTCHTRAPGTEIRDVQLDGRIRFWYVVPGDRQVMIDCLRQAGSTGPALPEPIADSLPRGA